jgi:DNA-binding YbaB/EbfC family protein
MRILVAEGDPTVAHRIITTLKVAGYTAFRAATGAEAVQRAVEAGPQLLVLDISVSSPDYLAVLAALDGEERTEDLPVVLVSAVAEGFPVDLDIDRWSHRVRAFLPYPVDPGDIIWQMRRIFNTADSVEREEKHTMTRFGGLPGGLGGLGKLGDLPRLMQQMQEDTERLKDELPKQRIVATAGGGMVTATVDGAGYLVEIKIDPAVVDPADVEMLEDLVVTAVKEAMEKSEAEREAQMAGIMKPFEGLNLPPGLI